MRFAIVLLIGLAGAIFALDHYGYSNPVTAALLDKLPAEQLARAEIRHKITPQEISARVDKALSLNDYDDALTYAEVADFADYELDSDTQARLKAAGSFAARATRDTGNFVEGFISGRSTDTAGLAGSVTSDLTVVGDIRDISIEGSKMLSNEEYSPLILGLSVVGLTATGATVATGGGGLPARVGVTLLKTARKAGTLTGSFARHLGRLVEEAVDFPRLRAALKDVRLSDPTATRAAVNSYADHVKTSRLFPVFSHMDHMREAAGTTEAVRLMKYVETEDDLANVATMSTKFGRKTRGIIEITGRTSLRGFKILTNVALWLAQWLWAGAIGLFGLFTAYLGGKGLRRMLGGRRAATAKFQPRRRGH